MRGKPKVTHRDIDPAQGPIRIPTILIAAALPASINGDLRQQWQPVNELRTHVAAPAMPIALA